MKRKSLFTVLFAIILACSCIAGFGVIASAESEEVVKKEIFGFDKIRVGEEAIDKPMLCSWGGTLALMEDDKGEAGKATKITHTELTNLDLAGLTDETAIKVDGFESVYIDLFIEDITVSNYIEILFNYRDDEDFDYKITVGVNTAQITKNGWQTVRADLSDITLKSGVTAIKSFKIRSESTKAIGFSSIGLSSEKVDVQAVLYDFDKADGFPLWSPANGQGALAPNKEEVANKATKVNVTEHATWPGGEQWAACGTVAQKYVPTSFKLTNYKSMYLDFYVADFTKVRMVEVKIHITGENAAKVLTATFGTTGATPLKNNGWQTYSINIKNMLNYADIAAGGIISGLEICSYADAANQSYTYDKFYLSSEEIPLPEIADFEFNEMGAFEWNGFAKAEEGKEGNTKNYLTQSTNEANVANEAWLFEPGSAASTLNYKFAEPGAINKKFNGVEIKLFAADITKVGDIKINISDVIAPSWTGIDLILTGDIKKEENGWITLKYPIKPSAYDKLYLGIWMNVQATCNVKLDYFKFITGDFPKPLPENVLEDCSQMASIIWNGFNLNIAEGESATDKAWSIPAGIVDPSNINITFNNPVTRTGYNAIKIRLNVEDASKVSKLDFLMVNNDQWKGYQFSLEGKLVNGWQNAYVLFSEMKGMRSDTLTPGGDPRIPTNDPIDGYMKMMNVIATSQTPIKISQLEFVNISEISKDKDFNLVSKTAGEVDITELFDVVKQNAGATIVKTVKHNGADVSLTANKFTTTTEGIYEIKAAVTDGDFTQALVALYLLDTTAPAIAKTGFTAVNGASVSVASFFSITDADTSPNVSYTLTKSGAAVELDDENKFTAAIGTYVLDISVTDKAGNTANDSLTFTVNDNIAPVIALKPDLTFAVGTEVDLSQIITVTDNIAGEVSLTFTVKLGISNITLKDGNLFTPAKGGSYTLTVVATDIAQNSTEESFSITVPDSVKPVISGIDGIAKTATVGDVINLAGISAKDDVASGVKAVITVKLGEENITLTDDNKFTAAKAGTYKVTVTATDGTNPETVAFEIVVSEKPPATDGDKSGCGSVAMIGSGLGGGISGTIAILGLGLIAAAILKRKSRNRS